MGQKLGQKSELEKWPSIVSSIELIMRCYVCQARWLEHRAHCQKSLVSNVWSHGSGLGTPGHIAGRHGSLMVKFQAVSNNFWVRGHLQIGQDAHIHIFALSSRIPEVWMPDWRVEDQWSRDLLPLFCEGPCSLKKWIFDPLEVMPGHQWNWEHGVLKVASHSWFHSSSIISLWRRMCRAHHPHFTDATAEALRSYTTSREPHSWVRKAGLESKPT